MSLPRDVQIIYGNEKYLDSFFHAIDVVAKERIYVEMIAADFDKIGEFQRSLMVQNAPVYYAIKDNQVVGWCDIAPTRNPRLSHRGNLGMGLLPEFRGKGIGSQLLQTCLDHAKTFGLEKVELYVYSSNVNAIALYKKLGFVEEGLIKNYRKLDGQYFDSLAMAKFL